jgi:hypothetical protein
MTPWSAVVKSDEWKVMGFGGANLGIASWLMFPDSFVASLIFRS